MTKDLIVCFEKDIRANTAMGNIAILLRKSEKHNLLFAPWRAYPYRPLVHFSISYGQGALFLQFNVEEKFIKATHGRMNDPVYEDSCVEFFISFDEGKTYYNIEINCIGTVLGGFGQGKESRQLLPETLLEKIKSSVLINRSNKGIE